METTFHATVVNIYGTSESIALGVEVDAGMYLFDDLNYMEIQDGQLYITSLYNFVQPIIRYQISDRLVLRQDCGSYPFTRADIVLSRNEDILWFENDRGQRDFLHPLAIEGFCIPGLVDFQFCQTDRDSFEMFAETTDEKEKVKIKTEMQKRMQAILHEKQLDYVRFSVRFVRTISPDPQTGKKSLVTKKMNEPINFSHGSGQM
jgi:phenylacetate-CoA ligase